VAGHPLAGSWAKVDRARENLDALDHGARIFQQRHPYAFAFDERADTGHNTVYLRTERVPLRLSAIAGDVLHDLRSALDNLAWQLVTAEGYQGQKPGFHTKFPIYGDKGNFRNDVVSRSPKRSPGPLTGLDPAGPIWALITSEQPYHRPDPEKSVLGLLQSFSNLDKHRVLMPAGSIADLDVQRMVRWSDNAVLVSQWFNTQITIPLEHTTELARLEFDPSGPKPNVHVQGGAILHVAFGEDDRQVTVPDFDSMRVAVSTLLDKFDQFF